MDKDQPTPNAPRPPRPGVTSTIAKPPQPASQEAIISRIKSEAQKSKAILEQQNMREQQRQNEPNPAPGLEKAVGTATRAAEASSDLVKRLRQEKKQR